MGEFFTPPSLVGIRKPDRASDHGIIHDPAYGSGGMFGLAWIFYQRQKQKNYQQAYKKYMEQNKTNNAKLAKMNNFIIHG